MQTLACVNYVGWQNEKQLRVDDKEHSLVK